MILASIGASLLGIDRDTGWGPARTFLLGCGILLAITPHITSIIRRIQTRLLGLIPSSWLLRWQDTSYGSNLNRKLENLISSPQSFAPYRRKKKIDSYLTSTFLLTILIFTWIISVGRWVDWPDTTNYFHLQAQGFLTGQLHLSVQPSEQLLTLSDPYTFENRIDIPYLWDASFYAGKYFLYWGPTPAIITALLETALQIEIGDQQLVFIFTLGAVGFGFLLLRLIWNRYFPTLATWTILPVALMMGLANPTPWLLGRPAVYEAAIASGQFFFVGGLFWFLLGLKLSKRAFLYNSLSGLFFVAALGSRITLLPGIVALGLFVLSQAFFGTSEVRKRNVIPQQYSLFVISILLGLLFLGWYNFARFGDFFEFGHRYQLTSWGMAYAYQEFFSWRNITPNFYNYFLNGYRTLPVFPFVKPLWGIAGVPLLRAFAVGNYHAEQVTGILITSPTLLIGSFPIFLAFSDLWVWLDVPKKDIRELFKKLISLEGNTLYACMLAITISLLFPLSLISFNSMRYLFDFSLAVSITSAVGIGLVFVSKKISVLFKGFFAIMIMFLSLYSSTVGILLGITSYGARFEQLNPELFDRITRFFAY
jgi:hypothetical protein